MYLFFKLNTMFLIFKPINIFFKNYSRNKTGIFTMYNHRLLSFQKTGDYLKR